VVERSPLDRRIAAIETPSTAFSRRRSGGSVAQRWMKRRV